MTISEINNIYTTFKPYIINVLEVSNDKYVIECESKKEVLDILKTSPYQSCDWNENSAIITFLIV